VFIETTVIALWTLERFLGQVRQDTELAKCMSAIESYRLHVHVLALEALQLLTQQFLLDFSLIRWERAKALSFGSLVKCAINCGVYG